jgi:methylated-DNA-[protein]-cysteine S-methyltransferase
MRWSMLPTPIGDLGIAVDGTGVCRVRFGGAPVRPASPGSPGGFDSLGGSGGSGGSGEPVAAAAHVQLAAYFSGELTAFDVPLSIAGGTPFERAVWAAIADIPYAEMRTYGEIATRVGDPSAARAVGIACNRNPVPLLVPCHRVVGAGGKLVGFGGGLPRKRFLLELEARVRVERDFGAGMP